LWIDDTARARGTQSAAKKTRLRRKVSGVFDAWAEEWARTWCVRETVIPRKTLRRTRLATGAAVTRFGSATVCVVDGIGSVRELGRYTRRI
jgi:hypothetical protein